MGFSSAGSMPGQPRANRNGAVCFAENNRPPRMRKALRVSCADGFPLRDLNRGYVARPAKKSPNAVCTTVTLQS